MAIPKVGPPLGEKMGVSKYLVDNSDICPNKYHSIFSIFTLLSLVLGQVNFSPMSPTLLLTYPLRDEDKGIAMASLFLRLMLL